MLYIIAQSESVELQSQLVSAQTPLKENHVEDRGIKGGKKGGGNPQNTTKATDSSLGIEHYQ